MAAMYVCRSENMVTLQANDSTMISIADAVDVERI